jgi:hypothetical protein
MFPPQVLPLPIISGWGVNGWLQQGSVTDGSS